MYGEKMTGPSPRHGNRFTKSPPFLLPGLVVVILIISFNYWRTSRLNKELLENLSVAQARTQRLDHELKDAVVSRKEALKNGDNQVSDMQARMSEMAEKRAAIEREKNDLNKRLQIANEQLDTLRAENEKIQRANAQLQTDQTGLGTKIQALGGLNATIDRLRNKNMDFRSTIADLTAERLVVMDYVALELGKEGIEELLRKKVVMPGNLTLPSTGQLPLCTKRAEERLKLAAQARTVDRRNVASNIMKSPNDNMREQHQQSETDISKNADQNANRLSGDRQPGVPGVSVQSMNANTVNISNADVGRVSPSYKMGVRNTNESLHAGDNTTSMSVADVAIVSEGQTSNSTTSSVGNEGSATRNIAFDSGNRRAQPVSNEKSLGPGNDPVVADSGQNGNRPQVPVAYQQILGNRQAANNNNRRNSYIQRHRQGNFDLNQRRQDTNSREGANANNLNQGNNLGVPGSNQGGSNLGVPGSNQGGSNLGVPGLNQGNNLGVAGLNQGINLGVPGLNQGNNLGVPGSNQGNNLGIPGSNQGNNLEVPGSNQGNKIGVPGLNQGNNLGVPGSNQGNNNLGVPGSNQGSNNGVPGSNQGNNLGVPGSNQGNNLGVPGSNQVNNLGVPGSNQGNKNLGVPGSNQGNNPGANKGNSNNLGEEQTNVRQVTGKLPDTFGATLKKVNGKDYDDDDDDYSFRHEHPKNVADVQHSDNKIDTRTLLAPAAGDTAAPVAGAAESGAPRSR